MKLTCFYSMIETLRQSEEVVLYGKIIAIPQEESAAVVELLRIAHDVEQLHFPHETPAFDPDAALWGAQTVYFAAQFLLYREVPETGLSKYIAPYEGTVDASAILSADLCLRFLPPVLRALRAADPDDHLIELVEKLMQDWHFSGISYNLDVEQMSFDHLLKSDCLMQLYADRIIALKKEKLALLPALVPWIAASLGDHSTVFWKELDLTPFTHEHD